MAAMNSIYPRWGYSNVDEHHRQGSPCHCVWTTANRQRNGNLSLNAAHPFPLADHDTHDVILGSFTSATRAPLWLHHSTRPRTVVPFRSHPTSKAGMTTRSCRQGGLQAQQGCRP